MRKRTPKPQDWSPAAQSNNGSPEQVPEVPHQTDPSQPFGSSYLLVPPPSGWQVPASSDPSPLPTSSCILGAPPCRRVLPCYHSLQIPGSQGTCQTCPTAWPAPKTGPSRMYTQADLGRMSGAAGR